VALRGRSPRRMSAPVPRPGCGKPTSGRGRDRATRTSFAFHRDAVGLGISMNQKSEINYVPEKTSFLVSSMFSAGAVAIDDEGIVKISSTE
jgi:hypothetical protein